MTIIRILDTYVKVKGKYPYNQVQLYLERKLGIPSQSAFIITMLHSGKNLASMKHEDLASVAEVIKLYGGVIAEHNFPKVINRELLNKY